MKKKRKPKIRTRILRAFYIMLFITFAMIEIIFNNAIKQYIQNSATSQLDETYKNMLQLMQNADTFPRPPEWPRGFLQPNNRMGEFPNFPARRNIFRINANVFVINDRYNLTDEEKDDDDDDEEYDDEDDDSDEAHAITKAVKDLGIRITDLQNVLVSTGDMRFYYISAFPMLDNPMGKNDYFLIYADVTSLLFFSSTINIFLIILICIMFVFTIFFTFFLSNTITVPIKKLGTFAARIGRGDFTPSDFEFKDEEFDSLNAALNDSARQLSIYDKEQKTFFQNASHELRTPLMSIQCHAEGISFGIMEPKKASETILQETSRLSELVTDLLYISKIDNITKVYTAGKADLPAIIRSCAERQLPVAGKKNIKFSFDFNEPAIEYECVGELISRAVDNLISNAIRYASSEIVLSCQKGHDNITICVKDDGKGIEPESVPRIFERFYKGQDGSHGIGLSIVKSIVEQHHGSIAAKNTENGGAMFIITLPLEEKTKNVR